MSPEDSTLDSCCRHVVYVVNRREQRGDMRGLDRKPGGAGLGQGPRAKGQSGDASPARRIGARSLVQALGGDVAAPGSKIGGSTLTEQLGVARGAAGEGDVPRIAAGGVAGGGGPLPH